jgi:hypothetical protein
MDELANHQVSFQGIPREEQPPSLCLKYNTQNRELNNHMLQLRLNVFYCDKEGSSRNYARGLPRLKLAVQAQQKWRKKSKTEKW